LGEGQGVRANQLLLTNGDELSGSLLGIRDNILQWQSEVGPIDVKTDRIFAILFHPAQKTKQEKYFQAWIGLRDGSRLLATQLLLQNNAAKITACNQPLATSQSAIVFLQPLGGRSIYLSDLKPTAYHQTPYLDQPWPYRADRNVTGGMLRSNGRIYLKGLGVHSAARLVYTISPLPTNLRSVPGEGQGVRAKRFQSDLAIDDSTAGGGSVQFRVLVDGREKFTSPILRGGQPPLPMSIDISGATKLELIVDYADRADVLDRADWLNARLTW
jgi:hypothetical protein